MWRSQFRKYRYPASNTEKNRGFQFETTFYLTDGKFVPERCVAACL
jgi:hypothetical protein